MTRAHRAGRRWGRTRGPTGVETQVAKEGAEVLLKPAKDL